MATKTNVIQMRVSQAPIDSTPEAPQVIMVRPKTITRMPELTFRNGRPDRLHVTALLQALRTRGELTPITLWRGLDGKLYLLDGMHRLEAFAAFSRDEAKRGHQMVDRKVPAVVFEGTFAEAMTLAIQSNSMTSLPLSAAERASAAWRLVRNFSDVMSRADISRATAIGTATVSTMRARWAEMKAINKIANGHWSIDRNNNQINIPEPTQEEKDATMEKLQASLKIALRSVGPHGRNPDIIAEALKRQLGCFLFKRVVSSFLSTQDEPEDDMVVPLNGGGIKQAKTPDPMFNASSHPF
jgi:hypothetical protein